MATRQDVINVLNIRKAQAELDRRSADEKNNPGFMASLGEMATGNKRATPQTDALPEFQESNLLQGESAIKKAALTPALLTATDPNEIASIVTSNFPSVGVTYNKDGQGNVYPILTNNETGAVTQINRPGMSAIDVIQGLFTASAFTPASVAGAGLGGIAKVATAAGASGATSAAIEGSQALSGGDFDAANVAIDTVAGGAFEAVGGLLQANKTRTGIASDAATQDAIEAEASRISQDLSPEAIASRLDVGVRELVGAAESTGRKRKTRLEGFAEEVLPDQEILKAADELGMKDQLIPSQYSQNSTYVEIEQALAGRVGSKLSAQQKASINTLSQKADDLIVEFGGDIDKSGLSQNLTTNLQDSIKSLGNASDAAYSKVSQSIPDTYRAPASNLLKALEDEIEKVGGEESLTTLEKSLLKMARQEGNPTYYLLDKERKKIGATIGKSADVYKNETSATLKKYYGLLTEDQGVAAAFHGDDIKATWDIGKGLVKQRKDLENASVKLLGKELNKAIMPEIGRAVKKLTTGDFGDFDKLAKLLPADDIEKVVLSSLNDAFTTGSRKEKQLNVPGFVDWMNGLNRNKEAKKRIYGNLPIEARKRLDNIFMVAKGMRNASSERILTGRINTLLDDYSNTDGMISKLYQTGKKVAMAEGATSSAGLPGAGTTGVIVDSLSKSSKEPIVKAADNLLSSPEFRRSAMLAAQGNVRTRLAQKAADKALSKSLSAQKWVSLLPPDIYKQVAKVGIMTYLSGGEQEQPE